MSQSTIRPLNLPVAHARLFQPRFKVGRKVRLAWAIVWVVCWGLLTVAASLTPDPARLGTHRQLGLLFGQQPLPPCSWPLLTGLPCPTCGMTTSFANVVRGRFVDAFLAQPAGMIFCLAIMAVSIYAMFVAVTGWARWINWDRIASRLMLGIGLLIVAGWAFKIAYGLWTGILPYQWKA